MVQFGEMGFCVASLNDTTWFYKEILTVNVFFGINDRWFSVVVNERTGRVVKFTQVESEVEKLVGFLRLLMPGVSCRGCTLETQMDPIRTCP